MFAALFSGFATTFQSVKDDPELLWTVFAWHKSFGTVALVLGLVRVGGWIAVPLRRLTGHDLVSRVGSSLVQVALAGGTIAVPVLGILTDVNLGTSAPVFGISLEAWKPAADPERAKLFGAMHGALAFVVFTLIFAHVAGALKHRYWDRDLTLQSMLGPVVAETERAPLKPYIVPGLAIVALAASLPILTSEGPATRVTAGAEGNWTLLVDQSRFGIEATAGGFPLEARFTNFDAEISFDPDDPAAARVRLVIDPTSFVSGYPVVDERVGSATWLAPDAFPEIVWLGEGASRTEDGFVMTGDLMVRDATLPVTVTFQFSETDGIAQATGTAQFNRLDIGLGSAEDNAALDIGIVFTFVASRSDAGAPEG